MRLALKEAWKYQFITYPNPAVGCVVLDKYGKILSIKAHKVAGGFHAERLCVNEILEKYGKDVLKDSTFYVTLEPCSKYGRTPPCSELLIKYKAKKLYVGSFDETQNGIAQLKKAGIKVECGILKDECDDLIKPFKRWIDGKAFVIFKMALNLNANNQGKISNEYLKEYFHEIRSKLDLLVVGGNTIRTDNPILDARYSTSKKAPDLLIFSKNQNTIKNSDLNYLKINRKCSYFQDNFMQNIKQLNAKHIMIEGGFRALELFYNDIDWVFLQLSNHTNSSATNFNLSLKPIYQSTTKDFYNKVHDYQQFGFYEIRK